MSNPTKAEWREYALLQVLQDKPVTPWETWSQLTPACALLRANHPHLTDEEVVEWHQTT